MGLERIEKIKEKKPFSVWDIVIYGILAVFVIILFAVFVFGADRTPMTGIRIVYREKVIYTYSFEEGGTVMQGWENRFSVSEEVDFVKITFYSDDEHSEFNVLTIDTKRKTAKMTDANCSRHKDCLYMQEIASQSGVIVCVPHGIKVLALNGDEDFSHPSLG